MQVPSSGLLQDPSLKLSSGGESWGGMENYLACVGGPRAGRSQSGIIRWL